MVRFAEEHVDVLRHYDVAVYLEAVLRPDSFKCVFEDKLRAVVVEVRETAVTAEGDEVVVVVCLVTFQTTWHGPRVVP